jgi:hypothetical protein
MMLGTPVPMNYEQAVEFAVLHFDATPCGRGWEGTKPGCKRASKGQGKKTSGKKSVKPKTTSKNPPKTKNSGSKEGDAFWADLSKRRDESLKQISKAKFSTKAG